ncbi:conserved hypothetical protein [Ricinus communis]|uniref:Uncharacterized protein n=1 Tax=Ricinus communis TaxID=3988 RepID=B9R894_RICCO|nr:conserved hypothetical protein [Ricinus communis]
MDKRSDSSTSLPDHSSFCDKELEVASILVELAQLVKQEISMSAINQEKKDLEKRVDTLSTSSNEVERCHEELVEHNLKVKRKRTKPVEAPGRRKY